MRAAGGLSHWKCGYFCYILFSIFAAILLLVYVIFLVMTPSDEPPAGSMEAELARDRRIGKQVALVLGCVFAFFASIARCYVLLGKQQGRDQPEQNTTVAIETLNPGAAAGVSGTETQQTIQQGLASWGAAITQQQPAQTPQPPAPQSTTAQAPYTLTAPPVPQQAPAAQPSSLAPGAGEPAATAYPVPTPAAPGPYPTTPGLPGYTPGVPSSNTGSGMGYPGMAPPGYGHQSAYV